MGAFNINLYYGCETCEAADEYGRGCKYGLLFPVLLVMANKINCPNYKFSKQVDYGIEYKIKKRISVQD